MTKYPELHSKFHFQEYRAYVGKLCGYVRVYKDMMRQA